MVKFSRPVKQDSYLRQRLFDQLDKMRKNPVIWISAPAGAGKTTLVSSYIGNRKLPCLWYQCDKDDGDPATFFYYMGLAAAKASPGKRKPLALFTPEYQHGLETFTRNYFQQLYLRLKKPSLLILDNYQDIADNPEFLKIIKTAFAHIPDGVNIIVISRQDPPDALIRLQANDIMDILRWPDIRLTEEEARGVIHAREKTPASEEIFQDIYKISEGWAAGLVLMTASLKNRKGKTAFTGKQSHEEIITYFGQEIFNHLDTKMQKFFMRTAFLPQMTTDMAVQITGVQSAEDILRTMNKKNYFISKHGHAESVYEYHTLYRNFLLSRAKNIFSPEQLHNIRIQAAKLLEQNNQVGAAVSLLSEIKAWPELTGIVLTHATGMLQQGRYHLLRDWLNSFPSDLIEINSWLLYWRGMSILPFAVALSQPDFEKAFTLFQAGGDYMGAMLAASGMIYSIVFQFDNFKPLDQWFAVLNDLASRPDAFINEQIEASVITSLILASGMRDMPPRTTEAWEERALKIPETAATISDKAVALHFMFWRRLLYNGIPEALPVLNELNRLSCLSYAQPAVSLSLKAAEAQNCLFTGRHSELLEKSQQGLELSRQTGIHTWDTWFNIYALASFIMRADHKGASTWLKKIQPGVQALSNWSNSLYHTQLTNFALMKNDYVQALSSGKVALDSAIKAENPMGLASTCFLLAQAFQLSGKREEAQKYFSEGNSYVEKNNPNASRYVALMIAAQFAFDESADRRGLLLLGRSLALARECGYVFSYCDNPTVMIRMCVKALEAGIEVAHVQEIIRRRGLVPDPPPVHIENWPWPVKIYTLGRFVILIDGAPMPPQRKAKPMPIKLLQSIIALGGRDVSCEKLSDLLWPDTEGDIAHHVLETTLQRLRKMLGHPESVCLANGKLTLDNRYCWVDTWAFERLLGQADNCRDGEKEEPRKKELLEKAISLYKGDFFSGEKEESWMILPVEHLKTRYFKSVWWLVNYLEKRKQWNKAARHCENFLKSDECREDIYRKLMLCHKNMGNYNDALLVYERCRKTLSSLLGINPSAETKALYNEIKAENFKTAE